MFLYAITFSQPTHVLVSLAMAALDDFRQMVVEHCKALGPYHGHLVLPTSPPYFVKYGNRNLRGEARTLRYLYTLAQNDPNAPRVPKLIDAFSDNGDDADEPDDHLQGSAYIVMEYIDAPTLAEWINNAQSASDRESRMTKAVAQLAQMVD